MREIESNEEHHLQQERARLRKEGIAWAKKKIDQDSKNRNLAWKREVEATEKQFLAIQKRDLKMKEEEREIAQKLEGLEERKRNSERLYEMKILRQMKESWFKNSGCKYIIYIYT